MGTFILTGFDDTCMTTFTVAAGGGAWRGGGHEDDNALQKIAFIHTQFREAAANCPRKYL